MNTILLGLILSISTVAAASPAKPAVSMQSAKRAALARVEGGTIIIDRHRRIIEVHVDANSGDVVGVEEESAQKEREEAGHERQY
jgi:uncharacterized membrane protein YkoI